MVTSVNASSLAALLAQEQALANRTQGQGQPAASTVGGDTTSSQDPAVIYSGAGGTPNLSAILSVQASLNNAASLSDVGLSAGGTITDLLATMREKVAAAQSASPDQQAGLDADYQQLLQTVDQIANGASFGGVNMLNGGSGSDLTFNAGLSGDSTVSLTPLNLTTAGLGLSGSSISGSSDDLASLLVQVDQANTAASGQLGQMGAQSDQIQAQLGVVSQLQSSLAGGADPDAETAQLQALSVAQMLSSETSGLANQAPQALLSLFRAG
jgi:flagellin